MTPGMAATKPASTESTASRELAATSSPSPATVFGTRALLTTMWTFDSTRTAKASGKSIRPLRWPAIERQTMARLAEPAMISARRPPRLRSITGESRGATTANGATVSRRYRATLPRAAWGEIEKNSDPARAMVTNVSPATASMWTTASRENGDPLSPPWRRRGGRRSGCQPASVVGRATTPS